MLMPHGLLVLVVDGSRMQLLRNLGTEAKPDLELVASDYEQNPPTHVLGSDRPGRSFASSGSVRHAYADDDLHDRREREFAAAALDLLSSKVTSGTQVVLIAPPRMLGWLRKTAPVALQRHVVASFDKDLAQASPAQIRGFLADQKQ